VTAQPKPIERTETATARFPSLIAHRVIFLRLSGSGAGEALVLFL
jgi:hypothetical protein